MSVMAIFTRTTYFLHLEATPISSFVNDALLSARDPYETLTKADY